MNNRKKTTGRKRVQNTFAVRTGQTTLAKHKGKQPKKLHFGTVIWSANKADDTVKGSTYVRAIHGKIGRGRK